MLYLYQRSWTRKKFQIEQTMDEFTLTFKLHGRNIIAS